MILVDFSSIIHRMVFASSKEVNPSERNGKYITSEFAPLMLHYIMNELIMTQLTYQPEFGEMVILFDDWRKDYWRKDVYPAYKAGRKKVKDKSKIDYTEVYTYVNELVEQLEKNTPWRCVTVDRAEADDTMLVLSREFCEDEKICIYSPDKDMLQAQRWTNNVFQYSPLTHKWLVPEHKHDSMEHWVMEHVMLGDDSDGVPKVVSHCEFSENFIKHLKYHGIKELTPHEFKQAVRDDNVDTFKHSEALDTYNVQKTNRAGEEIGIDLYKDVRFGTSTLNKSIQKHGSLESFLDSHPLYREHYERNYTLVMEEGIPDYIKENTLKAFEDAKKEYNKDELIEYLRSYNLFDIEMGLIKVFKPTEELTVENCGW